MQIPEPVPTSAAAIEAPDQRSHCCSQSSATQDRPAPTRPVAAFLSYSRSDETRVKALQRELRLRGLRAWRDVTNLRAGVPTPETITAAISEGSDAFVAYVTPEFLTSDFIWRIEIPAAVARHDADSHYAIIPVFDGVTPAQLTAKCEAVGQIDLSRFNGRFAELRGSRRSGLKGIARATLEAVVCIRFAHEPSRPINVAFQTGAFRTSLSTPDLEIDWSEEFVSPCPVETVWNTDLLPALHDLREVIARNVPSRRVVGEVYARLSAALALGHALSAAHGLELVLRVGARDGTQEWSADRLRPRRELLRVRDLAASGDPAVGVVEVAISRDTNVHTTEFLRASGVSARRRIHLQPERGGPSGEAIGCPEDAADMARQVATLLRSLHDEGVKVFHLFVAAPPAWPAILGHAMSAVGEVVVYQWVVPSGYQRGCTVR